MGFVLVLIIIALATILRVERYQLKTTLRNLIIAAVLINFSLTIAGVFIDFTNVVGRYFFGAASPEGEIINFSSNLAQSLNMQGLIQFQSTPAASLAETFAVDILNALGALLSLVVTVLMTITFLGLILIVFAGLAYMLLVRYIALAILLILMPLAWLFWTIPDLKNLWDKWWSQFLRWCFFLPASGFFLYLSILTFVKLGPLITAQATNLSAVQGATGLQNQGGILIFLQLLVKLSLLMATLIVADKMGIEGAKVARSAAEKFTGSVTGFNEKNRRKMLDKVERYGEKGKDLGMKVGSAPARALARRMPDIRIPEIKNPLTGKPIKGTEGGTSTQGILQRFSKAEAGHATKQEAKKTAEAANIAQDFEKDPTEENLKKIRNKAGSKWRAGLGAIPGFGVLARKRAANIQALSQIATGEGEILVYGSSGEVKIKQLGRQQRKRMNKQHRQSATRRRQRGLGEKEREEKKKKDEKEKQEREERERLRKLYPNEEERTEGGGGGESGGTKPSGGGGESSGGGEHK